MKDTSFSAVEILEAGTKYERRGKKKKKFDPKGVMLLAVIFIKKTYLNAFFVLAGPRVYRVFIFNLAQEGDA